MSFDFIVGTDAVPPATEVASAVVALVEFLELDLPSGNLYFTNSPAPITWGGNTYAPVTTTGAPYGGIANYSESTDSIPRPMTLTLSGVDPTMIANLTGNDIQWCKIIWSLGLMGADGTLANGTPFMQCPMFLGDCTIKLSENGGTISIDAENLLADMQSRVSGMFQTNQDQHMRGAPGNTTFSVDTFFNYAQALMFTWIYWGQQGPAQIGNIVGGGNNSGGDSPASHYSQHFTK